MILTLIVRSDALHVLCQFGTQRSVDIYGVVDQDIACFLKQIGMKMPGIKQEQFHLSLFPAEFIHRCFCSGTKITAHQ
ncbi:hypothetical protein SDC9_152101 [bioreactor metagenome]|uniref:Uncharacterized protein n=1 Tax=bioreactor metagenome TaxID=1076179 RepID=A0A645EWH7_9ZZZZ